MEQLRHYLEQKELKKFFDTILERLQPVSYHYYIMLAAQSGRWNELESRKERQLLTAETYTVQRNHIIEALHSLLAEIERFPEVDTSSW